MSFTTAQVTRMKNYMGRVDHQLNSSHSYSVRMLWDHQPTINQPLDGEGGRGPTIDTLSQDKDNDWTVVASYNWVIGSNRLYNVRAARVNEKPIRGQAALSGNRRLDAGAALVAVPELHRSGRHGPRGLPRYGLVRAGQHVHVVRSRAHGGATT